MNKRLWFFILITAMLLLILAYKANAIGHSYFALSAIAVSLLTTATIQLVLPQLSRITRIKLFSSLKGQAHDH